MSGHNRFYTIDELTRRERGFVDEIQQLRAQLAAETARADALQEQLHLQMGDPIARSNEDDPWNDGY